MRLVNCGGPGSPEGRAVRGATSVGTMELSLSPLGATFGHLSSVATGASTHGDMRDSLLVYKLACNAG